MRLNASKTPCEATPDDLLFLGSRASAPSIRGDLCGRNLAVLLPGWRHDAAHKAARFQLAKLTLSTQLRLLFIYDHRSPADLGRRPPGRSEAGRFETPAAVTLTNIAIAESEAIVKDFRGSRLIAVMVLASCLMSARSLRIEGRDDVRFARRGKLVGSIHSFE
jgi:hypothetical protein